MKSPELMHAARILLCFYVALALYAAYKTIHAFRMRIDPSEKTVLAAQQTFKIALRFLTGAVGVSIYGIASHQYYLLFAAAMLFSYVLPIVIFYLRVRLARAKLGPTR